MAYKTLLSSEPLARYVNEVITHETDPQKRLRAETAKMPNGFMQITPDQGSLLALLARLIGARKVLEVGTFTGYSALSVAAALPPDGQLIACDVSEEWTTIARRYWREAGLADRIELLLGPAAKTLAAMLEQGAAGSFDFAFIDADKTGYDAYYEAALQLLRPGGLIVMDNMLRKDVNEPNPAEPETRAIATLNLKIRDDARVDAMLATVGGGIDAGPKKVNADWHREFCT